MKTAHRTIVAKKGMPKWAVTGIVLGVVVVGTIGMGFVSYKLEKKEKQIVAEQKSVEDAKKMAVEFADHPERFKGKTITMEVIHYDGTLRDNIGKAMEVSEQEVYLRFFVEVPQGIDLPNISHASRYRITFQCTEGEHKAGNVLINATRSR